MTVNLRNNAFLLDNLKNFFSGLRITIWKKPLFEMKER